MTGVEMFKWCKEEMHGAYHCICMCPVYELCSELNKTFRLHSPQIKDVLKSTHIHICLKFSVQAW